MRRGAGGAAAVAVAGWGWRSWRRWARGIRAASRWTPDRGRVRPSGYGFRFTGNFQGRSSIGPVFPGTVGVMTERNATPPQPEHQPAPQSEPVIQSEPATAQ